MKHCLNSGFKGREVVDNNVPNYRFGNTVVLMTQHVANPANLFPVPTLTTTAKINHICQVRFIAFPFAVQQVTLDSVRTQRCR